MRGPHSGPLASPEGHQPPPPGGVLPRTGRSAGWKTQTGRVWPGNARRGFPKGRTPCYLYDRFGLLSAESSVNGRAARDAGLKPGGVDAMTDVAMIECADYKKASECGGLGSCRLPSGARLSYQPRGAWAWWRVEQNSDKGRVRRSGDTARAATGEGALEILGDQSRLGRAVVTRFECATTDCEVVVL